MKPARRTGVAAVLAEAVSAGIMASRRGNATPMPMPRRNVLRGNDILVMNMADPFYLVRRRSPTPGDSGRLLYRFRPHLKRVAGHDPEHDRRQAIVLTRRVTHDCTHYGHVAMVEPSAERVGEKLLGHRPNKDIRAVHECLPKRHGSGHFRTVCELARCIDRH